MTRIKSWAKQQGLPRLIIFGFLVVLIIVAFVQGQDMGTVINDVLVRFGMNLVLCLAMFTSVRSGVGMNFGLTVGILCGILSGLISIQLGLSGWTGIAVAVAIAIPFGIIAGYLYGNLLNAVKGSEMVVGTYVGYSIVSLMCIAWLKLPFNKASMVWPIGGEGLRSTITLTDYFDGILNKLMTFKLFGIEIPTGLLLFSFCACGIIWLFSRSKTGVMLMSAGGNPKFAVASGINVNHARIIGTVISTVLGAVGIIAYAQSYGFFQLYSSPLNMAFAPVAAALLGGASTRSIKISNIIIGTFMFQALLTIALPVANILMPEGNLSEVFRIIVSNGIILYALSRSGGAARE